MDAQVTLRLPKALDRALDRTAKARGVKKSQLVREAVAQYLAQAAAPTPEQLWERIQPLIGPAVVEHDEVMKDEFARSIYEHNFRE